MSDKMVLPDDPKQALLEIAGYLSAVHVGAHHAVIDPDTKEINGYWQTKEYLDGCGEIELECKRIALLIDSSPLTQYSTLSDLQTSHADWLKSVGWFKDKLPLESLFLINEELVEVGREFRQKEVDKDRVADELADVVLRTIGVAAEQDIDLQSAMVRKIQINLNRGTRGRVK